MSPEPSLESLLTRLERMLDKIERRWDAEQPAVLDPFPGAVAFTWQREGRGGSFVPVRHVDPIRLANLVGIERQLTALTRNTRQFLRGAPANHVLLWGERGSGKSSAVKALLNEYAPQGLRLVQVHRHDLRDLAMMMERLWDRPEKFLLFCDDLSFEADDAEYKELKALLEGGIAARPTNLLLYATSNRRHLMPERLADRQLILDGEEVHPNEAIEEQLSLADRFGLRLGFYKADQRTYLAIIHHLVALRGLPVAEDTLERDALRWSLSAAGRSGRSARQFVDDLEGRLALEQDGE